MYTQGTITVNSELDFPHAGSEASVTCLAETKRPIRLSLWRMGLFDLNQAASYGPSLVCRGRPLRRRQVESDDERRVQSAHRVDLLRCAAKSRHVAAQ